MTIKTLLIILIILIIRIIFLKAIRKLLSLALTIVILYFCYYTFFTYPGAVKFAIFRESFVLSSYKVDVSKFSEPKDYEIDPPIKIGKYHLTEMSCEESGPIVFCNVEVEE